MSSHTYHPDTHEHGLADDCPRCAEHAADPFRGLDDENLRTLYQLTDAWMRDQHYPRSDNELKAMQVMEQAILRARTLDRIWPAAVAAA